MSREWDIQQAWDVQQARNIEQERHINKQKVLNKKKEQKATLFMFWQGLGKSKQVGGNEQSWISDQSKQV